MKYLYTLLIIAIFPFSLFSQIPKGKLYTLIQATTGNSAYTFGYYSLPDSNFIQIDTIAFSDISIDDNRIFIASGNHFLDSLPVYIYDLVTDQKLDSISHLEAKRIDFWQDRIVTINNSLPYFSIHQAQSPYTFEYHLDSTYFPYQPVDLLVTGNKAFVLYQSSIVIVDLLAKDTIETVAINPPLAGGVGFGKYLTLVGSKIYIDVEYATGAIRSSMMSIDTATHIVDTTFHAEGFASIYQPIAGQDRLFMYNYDSFYQPSSDSLHLIPGLTKSMIEHDIPSQTDFVSRAWSDSLFAYQNGNILKTWLLEGYLENALWVSNEAINDIEEELIIGVNVYPNPFSSSLNMKFEESLLISEVIVYDIEGRIVINIPKNIWDSSFKIPTEQLSSGFYFLEVLSNQGIVRRKIVKE